MRRLAATLALALLASLVATPAQGRRHRLRVPGPQLAHALTVDAFEWTLRPSKTVVAAGVVRLRAYNRGEDDHNVLVVAADGSPSVVTLKPGEAGTLSARLAPGRYTIVCSLFAGTPDSHEARGMRFTLTAR